MKLIFSEYDGCFAINLEAETLQEAAALVRFGTNRTDEIRYASTTVSKEGGFTSNVTITKSKRANNDVQKRK